MRNTLKSIITSFVVLLTSSTFAQTVLMGDNGFDEANPADCSVFGVAGTNFFDDGNAGNYSANFNDTLVLCPDLNQGTKMSISFGINAGYEFDVDGSDFIYVYDGPNTTYPLLGTHNSVTDPTGFTHQASWNNPSGCLTIVFISDGAVEGTGWAANAQCGNQFQPFVQHVEAFINGVGPNALNPLDTGFVDVCFGDSILFVAKPDFPYSLETTGYGYSQHVDSTIDFDWYISDGGTYANNDSIWFTPPTRNGFLIDLTITDQFPQASHLLCKVRVSQLPNFTGTGPIDDTLCLGESTELIGGVTPTDTVGVSIPEGTFQLGGSFAGLTYLPDGSGQNYSTTINIGGFPDTATIQNDQDLNQICITMEHSYTGDLEIWLECPPVAPATTGSIVNLLNSYSGGIGVLPGGTSGGGTFLGHPFDDQGGGGAGIGWEYCFSSSYNTIGPMIQNWGNTVPVAFVAGTPNLSAGNSMDPSDTYAPETAFGTSLLGCPINGDWTIHVRDNLGTDDGYIFEWGLYFDDSFFSGVGGYQNSVVSDEWANDPTIISNANDTLIVVQPNVTGSTGYNYSIIDDFGCAYDTTVYVFVLPLPEIFNDTLACDFNFQVSGTDSYQGGVWYSDELEIGFNDATVENPLITTTSAGTYTIGYVDNACQDTVTTQIIFPQYPTIFSDTAICNLSFAVPIDSINSYGGGFWTLQPGAPGAFTPNAGVLNPTLISSESHNFLVIFTDSVCNNSDSAYVQMVAPPTINAPDHTCFYAEYDITSTSFSGGTWTIINNPNTPFLEDTAATFVNGTNAQSQNPDIQVSQGGTYTIQFTDDYCGQTVSEVLEFVPYIWTEINDTVLCLGVEFPLDAFLSPYNVTYSWSDGTSGPTNMVTKPGVYEVTITDEPYNCYTYSDQAIIEYQLCDIEAPNVISLSSTEGNNIWYVNSEGIAEFECFIVNRWGNLIYEYNNVNGGWNGRTKNGNLVEEGVYFYHIKAKAYGGEEIEKQGFITVVY